MMRNVELQNVGLLLFILLLINGAFGLSRPPQFTIDMSKPPKDRWTGAVDLIVQKHGWENSFEPFFKKYYPLVTVLPLETVQTLDKLMSSRYPDIYQEMASIAMELQKYTTIYTFNATVMSVFSYFYELTHAQNLNNMKDKDEERPNDLHPPPPPQQQRYDTSGSHHYLIPNVHRAACCGILSLPENITEDIVHGRNLDISPADGRNITLSMSIVNGTFSNKSGVILFTAIGWGWTTAAFGTTTKLGRLTMEWNWRVHGNYSLQEIMTLVSRPDAVPAAYVQRLVMLRGDTLDEAIAFLLNTPFSSPFYVTASGTSRRGAVLTIDTNRTLNRLEMLTDASNVTYMVQTNYDRWLPDPPNDPRRTVADAALRMMGRHRSGTELGVWMALSTYPVHNENTFFSALMSIGKEIEGYIRVAMVPDDPHPHG